MVLKSLSLLLSSLFFLSAILLSQAEGAGLEINLLEEHPSLGWNVTYDAEPATFGPFLNYFITGKIFQPNPIDGCKSFSVPKVPKDPHNITLPWIALIRRGECSFVSKIVNAQKAGAAFVIIYNNAHAVGNLLVAMAPDSSNPSTPLAIPSSFVTMETGEDLVKMLGQADPQAGVRVKVVSLVSEGDEGGEGGGSKRNWVMIVIIGVGVVLGSAGLVMLVLAAEYFRHRRESGHPMPKPAPLKVIITLPLTQVKQQDLLEKDPNNTSQEESSNSSSSSSEHPIIDRTCAVCLDDYAVGNWVRHLPCGHCFHKDCIDSWLKKYNRNCPVCKHDIEQGVEHKPLGPNEKQEQPEQHEAPETTSSSTFISLSVDTNAHPNPNTHGDDFHLHPEQGQAQEPTQPSQLFIEIEDSSSSSPQAASDEEDLDARSQRSHHNLMCPSAASSPVEFQQVDLKQQGEGGERGGERAGRGMALLAFLKGREPVSQREDFAEGEMLV